MAWLFNAAYLLTALILSPWLLYRRVWLGKGRGGWSAKFRGDLPRRDSRRRCLWLHAVSVGEVLQLRPLLAELSAADPELEFVISTTTATGYDVARKRYPEHRVAWFPWDLSWAVGRALDRIRPTAIALVELELWPNFIAAAAARGIPVAVINGRLSERSFRGYRRIRPVLRPALRRVSAVAVQTADYAGRFIALGAPPERVSITGSIKFDRVETNRHNPRSAEIRREFGIRDDERVFIAGSTQAPEEELALQTYIALRATYPELRLVLVPRHQERFEEVARLVTAAGRPLLRRSRLTLGAAPDSSELAERPVLLLDTLGELAACWGLADIAFVGGSLTRRGGQNMIEPAAYGAAVLFGPHTQNFRDITSLLLAADAARVVADASELTTCVSALLENPAQARALGARAQQLVLGQQGATRRTVEILQPLLGIETLEQTARAA